MLGFEDFFLPIYNKRLHFLLISIDINKMFWWWRSSHTFVFVSFNFCSVYVTIIRLGCLTRRLCVKQTLNHTPSPSERTCVGVSQWVRGDGRGSDVAGQCGGVWPPTSSAATHLRPSNLSLFVFPSRTPARGDGGYRGEATVIWPSPSDDWSCDNNVNMTCNHTRW